MRRADEGERVERLRRRLTAAGDLEVGAGVTFGATTESAVRRFQRRHGLVEDGLVGPATRAALDAPRSQQLARLDANLTARKDFDRPEGPYVLVNLPDFRLWWVTPDGSPQSMRVAIGKAGWETPVIDDQIETLEINPEWHLPPSIIAADLAPKVADEKRYLEENQMVVLDGFGPDASPLDPGTIDWADLREEQIDFHVMRKPGPKNPLGRIKFLFPNREHVYLHDTPHEGVFERRQRDVSHGCVRVEEPLALAGWLLGETDEWDEARVRQTIASGETERVALAKPIPVRIVYWTAWVDAEGVLHVREDLYGSAVHPTSEPL